MLVQFPKYIGQRKSRRRGSKPRYNALRIHPGKAYRINNGIDDLPAWPEFPPPAPHRGPIMPPQRMIIDRLGFQRPLPALPGNEGLPPARSSRAVNYITNGLVAQAPLIGICLTLGYYLAVRNKDLGIANLASSMLEDIQFPFGKPKRHWNWGDKNFQWVYNRDPKEIGWTFRRMIDDLSIPFKYEEELDPTKDLNLVPISGPGSHIVYIPSAALDPDISLFTVPSKTRTIAPTRSRDFPGPPKPRIFNEPILETESPELVIDFEYLDNQFPHRAVWAAGQDVYNTSLDVFNYIHSTIWDFFIKDSFSSIFDLMDLEGVGERVRHIFRLGALYTMTQIGIGWLLFYFVYYIGEKIYAFWDYLSRHDYRLIQAINRGCNWVLAKLSVVYGWCSTTFTKVFSPLKKVAERACLTIHNNYTICRERLYNSIAYMVNKTNSFSAWLESLSPPDTLPSSMDDKDTDSQLSAGKSDETPIHQTENENTPKTEPKITSDPVAAAFDDSIEDTSEQVTPRARPADYGINYYTQSSSKQTRTSRDEKKIQQPSGFNNDKGPILPPARSDSLHHKLDVKENDSAPGGFEFTRRMDTRHTRNTEQDDNILSSRQPSGRSSFSDAGPDTDNTHTQPIRTSIDDSFFKGNPETTGMTANIGDQTIYNPEGRPTESATIGDKLEELMGTRIPRPYSASSSNSPRQDTDQISFLERYRTRTGESSPGSDVSGASNSRIPRPPLPGATPGSMKPGSVHDRLKNFQSK